MKKWLFVVIVLFSSSAACADEPEKREALSTKVVLQNTQGYFVLSDKSCWKVIGFSKRWRSISEWWNDVQLVPKNYECVPNDWHLGSQIEVYAKYGNLEVDEANASNQETLKQCTHLFVNYRTGQVLFAIALEPGECIMKLFADASEEGYNKGFSEGRAKGYQNATEIYNNGRAEGYKAGYADGFQTALRPAAP